jgi:hypothetical protein
VASAGRPARSPAKPLVYAAVMEGDRAFPGLMIAEKMSSRLQARGLLRPYFAAS